MPIFKENHSDKNNMFTKTEYGAEIFFSNELRKQPELLLKEIGEILAEINKEEIVNILVKLDDPDPLLKPIDHMQIGDLLSDNLIKGSKVAVYCPAHLEKLETVFTEVIIHGRGTPMKYFNQKADALLWFAA
ncbi:MAG: hypothetical protein ABJH69_06565 [Crocinitomicaceae bacterium]